MDDVIVSGRILANIFAITERRVLQLVQEGLPKTNKGLYPVFECVHFYINYLHDKVGNHSQTMIHEKVKLLREKAERAALENQRLRNQVIDIDGITQQVMDLMQKLRDGLSGIPGRLCHELVGKTEAEIRQMIDVEIKQTLNGIAEQLEGIIENPVSERTEDATKQTIENVSIESSSGSPENEMVSQRG